MGWGNPTPVAGLKRAAAERARLLARAEAAEAKLATLTVEYRTAWPYAPPWGVITLEQAEQLVANGRRVEQRMVTGWAPIESTQRSEETHQP